MLLSRRFFEQYRYPIVFEILRKKWLQNGEYHKVRATYDNQRFCFPDENNTQFWDQQFSNRTESFPMEEWRNNLVASLIDPKKSLLSVGVGQGRLERILLQKYGSLQTYLGTDITQETLTTLKKKFPSLPFKKATLPDLKINQQFDQIAFLEVLEHIKPTKTFAVLRTLVEHLKPGGKLFVSVPLNEGLERMLPINPNSHQRLYSIELVSFELKAVGLQIQDTYTASAFQKYFWLKHIINKLFKLKHSNNVVIVAQKPASENTTSLQNPS